MKKTTLLASLLFCLTAFSAGTGCLAAEHAIPEVGPHREINPPAKRPAVVPPGGSPWYGVVANTGTEWLRLHFAGIVDTAGTGGCDYRVVVSSSGGTRDEIPRSVFKSQTEFWTVLLAGDRAEWTVEGCAPSGLSFVVDKYSFEEPHGTLLSVRLPDDRKLFWEVAEVPGFGAVARAVARVSFPVGAREGSCTAFLVAPDRVLTNHHCISDQTTCQGAVVIFDDRESAQGVRTFGSQYRCRSLLASNRITDYALLQLDREVEQRQPLTLAAAGPAADQVLVLFGHPGGRALTVSREGCSATTVSAPGVDDVAVDFGHVCDTEGGNSGSPVLDAASFQVIGLHHWGFELGEPTWNNMNRAVKITEVVADIDRASEN